MRLRPFTFKKFCEEIITTKSKMYGIDFSELAWFVSITILINCLVFILCGAFELIEHFKMFESAKIQKKPVSKSRPPLRDVILHLLKLHFVAQPLGLPVVYLILSYAGMKFSGPRPCWQEVAIQLPLFLLVEDFSFYWLHRALHTPFLYKHIHKLHHQYKEPNSWAVEYAHPLEYIFVNSTGLFLGPVLLQAHVYTFWIWLMIRLAEGVDGHCGYDLWFSPFRYFPFRPGANVHDFHHSHNVGNYCSFFTFWDKICGTDLSYRDYKEKCRKGANL